MTDRFRLRCVGSLAAAVLLAGASLHAQPLTPPPAPTDAWAADPFQNAWTWRPSVPSSSGRLPWPEAFAFREVMPSTVAPGTPAAVRWLSLQPASADMMPAFYDTFARRLVMLSARSRVLCNGAVVDRVLRVSPLREGGLPLYTSFSLRMADGSTRRTAGYGQLDEQGRWTEQPVDCARPGNIALSALPAPTPPGLFARAGGPSGQVSRIEPVTVLGQPALRDRRSGRWLTPEPTRDPLLAQWLAIRRMGATDGVNTGYGVVDAAGRLVVPLIFDRLPDVAPDGSLRLCIARRSACIRHPLKRAARTDGMGLRPARADDGQWGYVDRQGRWVVQARYKEVRPFVHGYAMVYGSLPKGWEPPGWRAEQPIVTGVARAGRAWIVTAVSGRGVRQVRQALMDDQRRWLVPFSNRGGDHHE